MFLNRVSGSPAVKQYRRYRNAGRALNQKIIEVLVDSSVIEKSARALGLGKNRRLILDTEDDLSVLMDFALGKFSTYRIFIRGTAFEQQT